MKYQLVYQDCSMRAHKFTVWRAREQFLCYDSLRKKFDREIWTPHILVLIAIKRGLQRETK